MTTTPRLVRLVAIDNRKSVTARTPPFPVRSGETATVHNSILETVERLVALKEKAYIIEEEFADQEERTVIATIASSRRNERHGRKVRAVACSAVVCIKDGSRRALIADVLRNFLD